MTIFNNNSFNRRLGYLHRWKSTVDNRNSSLSGVAAQTAALGQLLEKQKLGKPTTAYTIGQLNTILSVADFINNEAHRKLLYWLLNKYPKQLVPYLEFPNDRFPVDYYPELLENCSTVMKKASPKVLVSMACLANEDERAKIVTNGFLSPLMTNAYMKYQPYVTKNREHASQEWANLKDHLIGRKDNAFFYGACLFESKTKGFFSSFKIRSLMRRIIYKITRPGVEILAALTTDETAILCCILNTPELKKQFEKMFVPQVAILERTKREKIAKKMKFDEIYELFKLEPFSERQEIARLQSQIQELGNEYIRIEKQHNLNEEQNTNIPSRAGKQFHEYKSVLSAKIAELGNLIRATYENLNKVREEQPIIALENQDGKDEAPPANNNDENVSYIADLNAKNEALRQDNTALQATLNNKTEEIENLKIALNASELRLKDMGDEFNRVADAKASLVAALDEMSQEKVVLNARLKEMIAALDSLSANHFKLKAHEDELYVELKRLNEENRLLQQKIEEKPVPINVDVSALVAVSPLADPTVPTAILPAADENVPVVAIDANAEVAVDAPPPPPPPTEFDMALLVPRKLPITKKGQSALLSTTSKPSLDSIAAMAAAFSTPEIKARRAEQLRLYEERIEQREKNLRAGKNEPGSGTSSPLGAAFSGLKKILAQQPRVASSTPAPVKTSSQPASPIQASPISRPARTVATRNGPAKPDKDTKEMVLSILDGKKTPTDKDKAKVMISVRDFFEYYGSTALKKSFDGMFTSHRWMFDKIKITDVIRGLIASPSMRSILLDERNIKQNWHIGGVKDFVGLLKDKNAKKCEFIRAIFKEKRADLRRAVFINAFKFIDTEVDVMESAILQTAWNVDAFITALSELLVGSDNRIKQLNFNTVFEKGDERFVYISPEHANAINDIIRGKCFPVVVVDTNKIIGKFTNTMG